MKIKSFLRIPVNLLLLNLANYAFNFLLMSAIAENTTCINIGDNFSTMKDARTAIKAYAKENDFAAATRRSEICKLIMVCKHSGKPRNDSVSFRIPKNSI